MCAGASTASPAPPGGPPRAAANPPGPARTCTRCYPGQASQVRQVRAFLARMLEGCPAASDAVLLADELAANAVQHSRSGRPGGIFTVTAHICPGHWVRVEIADEGGPGVPHLRGGGDGGTGDGTGGRGLQIVRALSGGWGVAGHVPGRTVWFVLPWGRHEQPR